MKIALQTIILQLLIIFVMIAREAAADYSAIFLPVCHQGQFYIALRSYQDKFLLVNPYNCKTSLQKKDLFSEPCSTTINIQKTTYYQLLTKVYNNNYQLANYGIKSLAKAGFFLTIDLCPTSKVFEKAFFYSCVI